MGPTETRHVIFSQTPLALADVYSILYFITSTGSLNRPRESFGEQELSNSGCNTYVVRTKEQAHFAFGSVSHDTRQMKKLSTSQASKPQLMFPSLQYIDLELR